ncbi:MAG: hypothetical protein ACK5IN_09070 [Microbacterium sp.]|uniref:hypothetical protein n=1 Tax=Microbacterium sp. TaxID=51671 RepID=UPI003A867851
MSAAIEAFQPLGESAARRRTLRPLARARRRRPRIVYALTALAGALAIAAVQMGLSIATTESTYRVSELTQQQRELTWQKQSLTDAIAGLSSPQYLAANAESLGMVVNESPTYVRLSDGAILGSGTAAGYRSSISALDNSAVPNAIVAQTPLITAPDATIQGVPTAPVESAEADADSTLPPPLTDGLPTPTTR